MHLSEELLFVTVYMGGCVGILQLILLLTSRLLYSELQPENESIYSVVVGGFSIWLGVTFIRLAFLISWPQREINHQNMPATFKEMYPYCRCIIDCSETFIETPKCFHACSKTYYIYKKHNTIKFLIKITPMGTIYLLSITVLGDMSI